MFPRFFFAYFLAISMFFCSTAAFAGKMELTTYYPAPNGEYGSLSATNSFIPPRMTTAQRNTILTSSTPPLTQGMVIFNTTTNQLEVYNGTAWTSAGSTPSGAIMAFNLSSYLSGWSPANGTGGTPDLRGVFVRGLDSGRGIDPGRTLGTYQDYATASPQRTAPPDTNVAGFNYWAPHSYGFLRRTNAWENRTTQAPDATDSGTQPDIISWSSGDIETRPNPAGVPQPVRVGVRAGSREAGRAKPEERDTPPVRVGFFITKEQFKCITI